MGPGCLLAVDDDRLTLTILEKQLSRKGHRVITASDGMEGLARLRHHAGEVEVVLLDRRMPGMDGMGVLQHIKSDKNFKHVPIVMLTSADTASEMREGLDAGVYYYLVKPAEEGVLDAVLAAALRESRQWRHLQQALLQQQKAFAHMETARFQCRDLQDAESLAGFLASCFPEPQRVLVGLAELLSNAVEHGNLGIGYVEKSRLLSLGEWKAEVKRRLALPENSQKFVDVVFQRKPEGVFVQITDMGNGFDWQHYLTIDPGRATHNHGRGIAQANAQCFDALRYNSKGNQVLVMAATGHGASQFAHPSDRSSLC